jgi:hypothetical protein
MEPRPNPRWPRGTCFAGELLRGCRKGSMLAGTESLLCIEVEEPGGLHSIEIPHVIAYPFFARDTAVGVAEAVAKGGPVLFSPLLHLQSDRYA